MTNGPVPHQFIHLAAQLVKSEVRKAREKNRLGMRNSEKDREAKATEHLLIV